MNQAWPLVVRGMKPSRGGEGSVEVVSALCMIVEAASWPAGCVCPDTCVLPKSHWFCVQFPTA